VGPAARSVLEEVEQMATVLEVPVVTVDERFSTVTAARNLQASGVRGRNRTNVIDQAAAAVLLQAWLDQKET
jgi:putative Holliday junction resolvase